MSDCGSLTLQGVAECNQDGHRGGHLVGSSHGEIRKGYFKSWHWYISGTIAWPTKDDPSVRMCIAAFSDGASTWMIGTRSKHFGVKVRQSLVYLRREFRGKRSMQRSSGGVSKCCPKEGSELDDESRDIDLHGALDLLDWEVSAAAWCRQARPAE